MSQTGTLDQAPGATNVPGATNSRIDQSRSPSQNRQRENNLGELSTGIEVLELHQETRELHNAIIHCVNYATIENFDRVKVRSNIRYQ